VGVSALTGGGWGVEGGSGEGAGGWVLWGRGGVY